MLWLTPTGREVDVSITPYLIDWDYIVSRPQKTVKDFLRPYWESSRVLEEFAVPGTRWRCDLINVNKRILVEVSPAQHDGFNPFFHGSIAGFKASLKRDIKKRDWAELNGLTYVEIGDDDLKAGLSAELFEERFGLTL